MNDKALQKEVSEIMENIRKGVADDENMERISNFICAGDTKANDFFTAFAKNLLKDGMGVSKGTDIIER